MAASSSALRPHPHTSRRCWLRAAGAVKWDALQDGDGGARGVLCAVLLFRWVICCFSLSCVEVKPEPWRGLGGCEGERWSSPVTDRVLYFTRYLCQCGICTANDEIELGNDVRASVYVKLYRQNKQTRKQLLILLKEKCRNKKNVLIKNGKRAKHMVVTCGCPRPARASTHLLHARTHNMQCIFVQRQQKSQSFLRLTFCDHVTLRWWEYGGN